MEDFDPAKAGNEDLFKEITKPPLESIAAALPPDGHAWLSGLNLFCQRVVEFDLRNAGPDKFVEHWKSLRDVIERLEREFGPSDDWK